MKSYLGPLNRSRLGIGQEFVSLQCMACSEGCSQWVSRSLPVAHKFFWLSCCCCGAGRDLFTR